jgi:adenine-specific DNA-methyltransferase
MELTTTGAGTYIKSLFDVSESPFPAPKNVGYLKLLISLFEKEPFIVLDFFSGSGTTADAAMQLNAEDGGNRRFIMVQLPEPCAEDTEAAKAGYKNICEIGKERIRRAGEKIKSEVEQQNAQLKIGEEPKKTPDIGFKDFKLDTSNLKKWQPDADDLDQSLFDSISNYVDDRTELDVVYEIMLKMGLDLTWPLETNTYGGKNVYAIGMGALMICLDDHITPDVAEGMVSLHKELAPETWKVVFKDNGFADDSAKVNIKEILKCAGLEEDAFTTV